MKDVLNKFKIPTILGLTVILIGLASGLFLVFREQIFLSQAAPNLTAQDITFSNQTEESITLSWKTNTPTASFVRFGSNNPEEQTALDDRDSKPEPHLIHYVTLKKLLSKTKYQFKIISGKISSQIFQFETLEPVENQSEFTPIIGSVLDGNTPLEEGIAYLSLNSATLSALIKEGNFLIPISQAGKLSEDLMSNLTIRSPKGEAAVIFKLKAHQPTLPSVKLGQNLDLTSSISSPTPTPASPLNKYDLNQDGKINSADYALLSSCFEKKISFFSGNFPCLKADLNQDGKIDQKDLDLMSQKIQTSGS